MPFQGSLMLQKGMDKRKEEELMKCKKLLFIGVPPPFQIYCQVVFFNILRIFFFNNLRIF